MHHRFVELSKGRILIDGVDVDQVPFEKLRKSLAIVPQDPTLFTGTLRENLDPYGKLSDSEIWAALEKVYMRDVIASYPNRLEMDVGERGGSFSIGQRQLLCLARALLRNARIVIMDEATSSIDRDTDALIQQTLRDCVKNATVVTIAHRLETIMEYDRVIVMAEGRILESGPPKLLAHQEESEFAQMVIIAGIDRDTL